MAFYIDMIRAFTKVAGKIAAAFIVNIGESDDQLENGSRLQDTELFGELNYRTGRLDSGTDPYGWYDGD